MSKFALLESSHWEVLITFVDLWHRGGRELSKLWILESSHASCQSHWRRGTNHIGARSATSNHIGAIVLWQVAKSQKIYRAHICHEYHELHSWRKNCLVEKFQLPMQNLNNLWSFIEVYNAFVPNLIGEKSVWRKNNKFEVWNHIGAFILWHVSKIQDCHTFKSKKGKIQSIQVCTKRKEKPKITFDNWKIQTIASEPSPNMKPKKWLLVCCTDLVRCKTWWKNAVQDKKFKSLMGNTYVCISSFVSAGTFFSWALHCMWVETYWTNYPTDCRCGEGGAGGGGVGGEQKIPENIWVQWMILENQWAL